MNCYGYFEKITHKKILIFGIYPPPYGGVSVHIQRVMSVFIQNLNNVRLFNTEQSLRSRFGLFYFMKLFFQLIWYRPNCVYYHSSYTRSFGIELTVIMLGSRLYGAQVHIIEHDSRHLGNRTRLFKRWYRWGTKHIFSIVFIGSSTYEHYKDHGIKVENYSIESAFLPPSLASEPLAIEHYPSSLWTFMKDYTPLLLVNAAHLMRINGKDVYGLDQAIDVLAGIKKDFPDAGLIMAVASMNDADYSAQLRERMQSKHVAEQVYILQDQKELWPLFKRVDLFLRPTLSDGASISVEEALYFKVPVVASNVCARQKGVVLYDHKKDGDLADVVTRVLYDTVYANQQCDSLHEKQT